MLPSRVTPPGFNTERNIKLLELLFHDCLDQSSHHLHAHFMGTKQFVLISRYLQLSTSMRIAILCPEHRCTEIAKLLFCVEESLDISVASNHRIATLNQHVRNLNLNF